MALVPQTLRRSLDTLCWRPGGLPGCLGPVQFQQRPLDVTMDISPTATIDNWPLNFTFECYHRIRSDELNFTKFDVLDKMSWISPVTLDVLKHFVTVEATLPYIAFHFHAMIRWSPRLSWLWSRWGAVKGERVKPWGVCSKIWLAIYGRPKPLGFPLMCVYYIYIYYNVYIYLWFHVCILYIYIYYIFVCADAEHVFCQFKKMMLAFRGHSWIVVSCSYFCWTLARRCAPCATRWTWQRRAKHLQQLGCFQGDIMLGKCWLWWDFLGILPPMFDGVFQSVIMTFTL